MANTKRLCCEAFVNRASRIPAPIHRFKEAGKRAKTLKNTNNVSNCPINWTPVCHGLMTHPLHLL
jgi:hypothetical protein